MLSALRDGLYSAAGGAFSCVPVCAQREARYRRSASARHRTGPGPTSEPARSLGRLNAAGVPVVRGSRAQRQLRKEGYVGLAGALRAYRGNALRASPSQVRLPPQQQENSGGCSPRRRLHMRRLLAASQQSDGPQTRSIHPWDRGSVRPHALAVVSRAFQFALSGRVEAHLLGMKFVSETCSARSVEAWILNSIWAMLSGPPSTTGPVMCCEAASSRRPRSTSWSLPGGMTCTQSPPEYGCG